MIFRRAEMHEADAVVSIIRERISWMDMMGFDSWNRCGYLSIFPSAYFCSMAAEGKLYVLSDGEIEGAAVILEEDERWPEGGSALYIHNLVARPSSKGAGRTVIAETERMALRLGKQELRLDASLGNESLQNFYRSLGFTASGTCQEGGYTGVRLRKILKP